MKGQIIAIFLLLFITQNSLAQEQRNYDQTLKKMFEVSGMDTTFKAALNQVFGILKKQYPKVDILIWYQFEEEFQDTSLNELVTMLTPVYQKYFSEEDLRELILFYQTPIGLKYAKNLPFVTQESMQVGQLWGAAIGERFVKKMKDRGYYKK